MMSAKYFAYYTIILRGAVFSWTHYNMQQVIKCLHFNSEEAVESKWIFSDEYRCCRVACMRQSTFVQPSHSKFADDFYQTE